jgi:hypothetical protein
MRRVHIFPFYGLGSSQTRRSFALTHSSGDACSLTSWRGATLSPDEVEERPSPKTWSLHLSDANEPHDGLLSGAQRCERPGGWEAVESMSRRMGVLGERDGTVVAPQRRQQETLPTFGRTQPTSQLSARSECPVQEVLFTVRQQLPSPCIFC